ncbi:unnamed protein product [Ilex paraguariensis]|uniref:25S rRNA (uridine-N(3))-methyltransferase BMT5-like domain-containing protein n=1 Tax=Ilex paraguariensis TaxID=185542 RepID=A0ABC8QS82_9AQUA
MESKVSVDDKAEKWIKHYSSSHKILLVGKGDFSFSACLTEAFGSASNMVATFLDSKETLGEKHPTAVTNLKKLEDYGCNIVRGLVAYPMSQHPLLNLKTFDRIVFNFPHAGFLLSKHSKLLTKGGEVHVTHKTAHPFSMWEIEKLAKEAGLHLVEEVYFTTRDYSGYENKRGYGYRSNDTFPVRQRSTFKFYKR